MYGLSENLDLSFLGGREVIQVAIGLYQVSFGFDQDVTISSDGPFKFFDGVCELEWRPAADNLQAAARTLSLLGATVQNYEAHGNGTLALAFSNGQRLTFVDSSQEYESYTITRPGKTIVV